MNNKKISQYKEALPWVPQDNNMPKEIIKANENTLRKAKAFPSATSVWSNSVYSFNKNYLKTIPAVDNMVNKIIKSFFSLNPLATNPKGKKSRLVQRRYKRLSLNKILVSKSEIKHTNDKVFITVYLFNKKKKSLLLKLKNLYNSLSLHGKAKSYFVVGPSPLNTNLKGVDQNLVSKVEKPIYNSPLKSLNNLGDSVRNNLKSYNKYSIWNKYNNKINVLETNTKITNNKYNIINYRLDLVVTGNKNNIKALSKAFFNKYGFVGSTYKKTRSKNTKNLFLKNVLYYKNLNNLTKSNIHSFLAFLGPDFNKNYNTSSINFNNLYRHINKYKLYNNENNILSVLASDQTITTQNYTQVKGQKIIKPNYSIYKLKSMYKLFVLYNNINSIKNLSDIYSKKIILNTYKLLKKLSFKLLYRKKINNKGINFLKDEAETNSKLKNNKSYSNLKKNMRNIILISKLNRIDRFINKYKNILEGVIGKEKSLNYNISISSQVINNYKINFINDLLEKELLYIYYLKLLSYNNAIFRNWFLYSLKTLVSKIYNKKVIFNLVNLKYMHLNSDILSQAVNIRLRNFKKNRLVKVLKKVIKLVPMSKVNIYAYDEHSSIYKYVENYHSKFRILKLDVFKEIGLFTSEKILENSTRGYSLDNRLISNVKNKNSPLKSPQTAKIRGLNHIQSSTINFIKYKSVFGVRLEAAGRLTKRSTASRSIFKFKYNGTLRNNPVINNSISSVIVKNNRISNLQFTKIASKTRNGSFGLKGWINNN